MTATLIKVPFHGHEIEVLEDQGERWLPLRPMCDRFGVSPQGQHLKLQSAEWATVKEMLTVAEDGKPREMTCLHLRSLAGWLFSIKPGKVKPEVRELLVAYQKEAAEVLYTHFSAKATSPALASPELVAQLAAVTDRLASLETKLAALAGRPDYPGGVIGPREASASILSPLRALARQLAHIRGTPYRSVLLKLDKRLRRLVGYPNDSGQLWARFPSDRYGELTGAVGLLQTDAQTEIRAHAERVARESQLSLAG